MLQQIRGIVVRSVKYGETSLVTRVFTRAYGMVPFMIRGVRSRTQSANRAAQLQPSMIVDVVVNHKPGNHMQQPRDIQFAHLYQRLPEDIPRNCVALYSLELLLKLLPEHAPNPELFDFALEYLVALDELPAETIANFPVYFTLRTIELSGLGFQGRFSAETPYVDAREAVFASHPTMQSAGEPVSSNLTRFLEVRDFGELAAIRINAEARGALLDFLLEFLRFHTSFTGSLNTLPVLRTVLR